MTLDEAIEKQPENERKYLLPMNCATLQRDTRLYIRVLEQTPRELKGVEKSDSCEEKAKERELHAIRSQELSTEIEAL
jgi:hypothetical protein